MQNPNFRIPLLSQKLLDSVKAKYLDIPYCDESPSQILDIYLPENTAKPYPVIMHYHGGAFMFGTQRDCNLEPMLRGLERGYAVVSVQYRMSGEARFPAFVWDSKAAVRWVRANADKYGFDSGKIAAWGPSAGGYIAAMMGVSGKNPAFEDLSQGNAEYSSEVQAIIDWCGPAGGFLNIDPAIRDNGIGLADHNDPASPESLILGAPIETVPELVELAAPYRYAHKGVPPFLIVHGEADPIVPVQQSRILAEAIEKAAGKERVTLRTYPGKGHHGDPWYDELEISTLCLDFLDSICKA